MKDRQPIFIGHPRYRPDWEITMKKIDAFNDVVLTDEHGNEIVTSAENPNLDRLLAQFAAREHEPGNPR